MNEIPKISNDKGEKIIELTFSRFTCIGASEPHDHPHVYLEMGEKNEIICPYCGTLYKLIDAIDYLESLKNE